MTTLTLHKLPEGFIVTSDEKPEIGELYIDDTNLIRRSVMGSGTYWANRNSYQKVIAQQDQIDFSDLTEEEQKEIGWFNIDSFIKEQMGVPSYLPVSSMGPMMESQFTSLKNIFQKAQELLYDTELFDTEIQVVGDDKTMSIRDFLIKPKSWTIEVEMEYQDMMGMWVSKPTILEHLDRPSRPKFTNGKLKVTKIL